MKLETSTYVEMIAPIIGGAFAFGAFVAIAKNKQAVGQLLIASWAVVMGVSTAAGAYQRGKERAELKSLREYVQQRALLPETGA